MWDKNGELLLPHITPSPLSGMVELVAGQTYHLYRGDVWRYQDLYTLPCTGQLFPDVADGMLNAIIPAMKSQFEHCTTGRPNNKTRQICFAFHPSSVPLHYSHSDNNWIKIYYMSWLPYHCSRDIAYSFYRKYNTRPSLFQLLLIDIHYLV